MKGNNTRLNSLIRAEMGSADARSQIYAANLEHRLCGGRRLCASAQFQPTITMSYSVIKVDSIGQNVYEALIQYTGVLSYLPYSPRPCQPCPVTETLFGFLSVPIYSSTDSPTVTIDTTGATPIVTPIVDCCNPITSEVLATAAFTVNSSIDD